jgi:hypothetical protein
VSSRSGVVNYQIHVSISLASYANHAFIPVHPIPPPKSAKCFLRGDTGYGHRPEGWVDVVSPFSPRSLVGSPTPPGSLTTWVPVGVGAFYRPRPKAPQAHYTNTYFFRWRRLVSAQWAPTAVRTLRVLRSVLGMPHSAAGPPPPTDGPI